MLLAKKIKEYRRKENLSIEAVATQLKVSVTTVEEWEEGHVKPS
jgi:DNA-binding transcriptional regulator YiaG